MSSLKTIQITNLQSHSDTHIDLPETGIVRFYGDNSNGKSVFVKAIYALRSGDISSPSCRRDLVRREHSYGELLLERYDGVKLLAHIHLEAAQTYCELEGPNRPLVRRYLSDKNISTLVDEFGIHYSEQYDISVNIHRDDDPLLFTSTKHSVNYALMDTTLADKQAECSLEELTRLIKQGKDTVKTLDNTLIGIKSTQEALTIYNIEEEASKKEELEHILYILERCETHMLPVVEGPLTARFYTPIPPMPSIMFNSVYIPLSPIPDILPSLSKLESIINGVCPTCGKKLITEEIL